MRMEEYASKFSAIVFSMELWTSIGVSFVLQRHRVDTVPFRSVMSSMAMTPSAKESVFSFTQPWLKYSGGMYGHVPIITFVQSWVLMLAPLSTSAPIMPRASPRRESSRTVPKSATFTASVMSAVGEISRTVIRTFCGLTSRWIMGAGDIECRYRSPRPMPTNACRRWRQPSSGIL